ncbi:MAG: DUF3110 domain-containing protein [Thermosynechococcaceae cyanobacterium]
MRVYVLLFNARTDNEGIHTIKLKQSDGDADYQDVVLAFEQEDDATRFALLLEAQDFPEATVEAIDAEELEEFCESSGLVIQQVTAGMLAVPPDTNVDSTDWQPEGSPVTPAPDPSEMLDLDAIKRRLENLL